MTYPIQGGPKTFLDHTVHGLPQVGPPSMNAYTFKTFEPICMIVGKLQRFFILNILLSSNIDYNLPPLGKSEQLGFRFRRLLR